MSVIEILTKRLNNGVDTIGLVKKNTKISLKGYFLLFVYCKNEVEFIRLLLREPTVYLQFYPHNLYHFKNFLKKRRIF